jgi:hypothetical protein
MTIEHCNNKLHRHLRLDSMKNKNSPWVSLAEFTKAMHIAPIKAASATEKLAKYGIFEADTVTHSFGLHPTVMINREKANMAIAKFALLPNKSFEKTFGREQTLKDIFEMQTTTLLELQKLRGNALLPPSVELVKEVENVRHIPDREYVLTEMLQVQRQILAELRQFTGAVVSG